MACGARAGSASLPHLPTAAHLAQVAGAAASVGLGSTPTRTVLARAGLLNAFPIVQGNQVGRSVSRARSEHVNRCNVATCAMHRVVSATPLQHAAAATLSTR